MDHSCKVTISLRSQQMSPHKRDDWSHENPQRSWAPGQKAPLQIGFRDHFYSIHHTMTNVMKNATENKFLDC